MQFNMGCPCNCPAGEFIFVSHSGSGATSGERIIKLDLSDGSIVARFGSDILSVQDMCADGEFLYVVAVDESSPSPISAIYKFDFDGNLIWKVDNTGDHEHHGVAVDAVGTVVTGTEGLTGPIGASNIRWFDSDGIFQVARSHGEQIFSVDYDISGNVVASGNRTTFGLAKTTRLFNSSFVEVWSEDFVDDTEGGIFDSNGDVFISGVRTGPQAESSLIQERAGNDGTLLSRIRNVGVFGSGRIDIITVDKNDELIYMGDGSSPPSDIESLDGTSFDINDVGTTSNWTKSLVTSNIITFHSLCVDSERNVYAIFEESNGFGRGAVTSWTPEGVERWSTNITGTSADLQGIAYSQGRTGAFHPNF